MAKLMKNIKKHKKHNLNRTETEMNNYKTHNEQSIIKDKHKKLQKLTKNKKHTKPKSDKEKLSQPQLVVLHEHGKIINQSSNELIPLETSKQNAIQKLCQKHNKTRQLPDKMKPFRSSVKKINSKYEKEAMKMQNSCNMQYLNEKLKKRQDKVTVLQTLNASIESKQRKKKLKLIHKHPPNDKSILPGMTDELIRKIKSLPFKVDYNHLIFMDPSHISKLLEYTCEPKLDIMRNYIYGNQDMQKITTKLKDNSKINTGLTEPLLKVVDNKHISSKHLRNSKTNKKLKEYNQLQQRNSKMLLCEPFNKISDLQTTNSKEDQKHRKKRSKYTVADKKKSIMKSSSMKKFKPIKNNKKSVVRHKDEVLAKDQSNTCGDKNNSESFGSNLSSQNQKLDTIYSESFATGDRDGESAVSNSIVPKQDVIVSPCLNESQNENNLNKMHKLSNYKLKCKSKKDKMMNVAKPLISEDGKRLTLQLVKADATVKHPKKCRKSVYNIERLISEERCNTVQRNRLMVFYANRESTSTSKDSLNIAISRDTELTNNGSSSNVLNVVIKQTKNSMPSNLTPITEKQDQIKCKGMKLNDSITNNGQLEKSVSVDEGRKSAEEKILKEAECQTDVFLPDHKTEGNPCEAFCTNREALDSSKIHSGAKIGIQCNSTGTQDLKCYESGTPAVNSNMTEMIPVNSVRPPNNDLSDFINKSNILYLQRGAADNRARQPSLKLIQNKNKCIHLVSNDRKPENWKESRFCTIEDEKYNFSFENNICNQNCLKPKITSIKPNYSSEQKQCLEIDNENEINVTKQSCITEVDHDIGSKLEKIGLSNKNSFIKIIDSNTQISHSYESKQTSNIHSPLKFTTQSITKNVNVDKKGLNKAETKIVDDGEKESTKFKNKYIQISNLNLNAAKANLFPKSFIKNCMKRLNAVTTLRNEVPIEKGPIGDHINSNLNKNSVKENPNNLEQNIEEVEEDNNIKRERFIAVLPEQADPVTDNASTQFKCYNTPAIVRASMLAVTDIGVQTDQFLPDKLASFTHKKFNHGEECSLSGNPEHVNSQVNDIENSLSVRDKITDVPKKKRSFIHVIKDNLVPEEDTSCNVNSNLINHNTNDKESGLNVYNSVLNTYNEKYHKEYQVVNKINAIYEFLQYLDKMLKDNAFVKRNVTCDTNYNLGKFNSTLRCLCSNCIEILNKIETNKSGNKDQYNIKELNSTHKRSLFVNIVEDGKENSSSVNYVSLNKIEPYDSKRDCFSSESTPRPFFVIIPPDENFEPNVQNISENGTDTVCLPEFQSNLEDQFNGNLIKKKINNSAAKGKDKKAKKEEKLKYVSGYIHTKNQTHEKITHKNLKLHSQHEYNIPINNIPNNEPSKYAWKNINFEPEIQFISSNVQKCISSHELSTVLDNVPINNVLYKEPSKCLSPKELCSMPEDNVQHFNPEAHGNISHENIVCSKSASSECISHLKLEDKYYSTTPYSNEKLFKRSFKCESQKFAEAFSPIETATIIYNDSHESHAHKKSKFNRFNHSDENDICRGYCDFKVENMTCTKANNNLPESQLDELEIPSLPANHRDIWKTISSEEKLFYKDMEFYTDFKGSVYRNKLHSSLKLNYFMKNDSYTGIPQTKCIKEDATNINCGDLNRKHRKNNKYSNVPKSEKCTKCKRDDANSNILHEPYLSKYDYGVSDTHFRATHDSFCDSSFSFCSSECSEVLHNTYTRKSYEHNKEIKYPNAFLNKNSRINSMVSASTETLIRKNPRVNADLKHQTSIFNKSPSNKHPLTLDSGVSRENLDEDIISKTETNSTVECSDQKCYSHLREADSELSFCCPFAQCNESVVFVNKHYPFSENITLPNNNNNFRANTDELMQTVNSTVGNSNGIYDTSGWISLSSCNLQSKSKSASDPENKVCLQMDIKMNDVMRVEFLCQPPVQDSLGAKNI
ncbi:hypothetical protein J6590_015962 [Homalodisca vitripennis]|nr:hypothetical protein J6590_015962 [Homalodisca vitripennis]